MSSSASTSANTFAFSTFTTSSFSNDTKDGLPTYSEVFASAPLLNETFPSSIFGPATNLSFEYDSSDSCGYSFLIRDAYGCLQAKGEVENQSISLQNVNGTQMLRITKIDEENQTNVRTFNVNHNHRSIGTVKVSEKGPASTCLQISQNNSHPEIVVRSLKIGDFAIYRPNSMSSPLCNLQMPCADGLREFNGSIIFHPETGINTEEQLLCTAAAIAFKVTMKRKTSNDDTESTVCGYFLGMVFTALIIGAFVLFFNYMEKRSCERRKAAGYSGYVGKEC